MVMSFDFSGDPIWPHPDFNLGHSPSLDYSDQQDLYDLDVDHNIHSIHENPGHEDESIREKQAQLQQIQEKKRQLIEKMNHITERIHLNEEYQNHINYILSEVTSINTAQLNAIREPNVASKKLVKKTKDDIGVDSVGFPYPTSVKNTNFVFDNVVCKPVSNLIKNNFSSISSKKAIRSMTPWTKTEEKQLVKLVREEVAQYHNKLAINQYLSDRGQRSTENSSTVLENNITASQVTDEDVNKNINNISWESIGGKMNRFPSDCLCHWLNYGDSRINKNDWTFEEEKKLYELVCKYNEHNWIAIANELDTHRTPYMCLEHYQKLYNVSLVNAKWSEDEDQLLLKAVEEHGHKNWNKISTLIPNRTPSQCRSRYHQVLVKKRRVGRWSNVENMALLIAKYYMENSINIQNNRNSWNSICQFLPSRNGTQCRERWENILKPSVSNHAWTREEDKKLVELVKKETPAHWSKIAEEFTQRTDYQCRLRYNVLMKKAKSKTKKRRVKRK